MTMDILCIGHVAYDVTLPLDGYPRENEKYGVSVFMEAGGGPAANAAYLLSKWGVAVGFVGLVGGDFYGNAIMREFKEIGTNLSLLQIEKDYPTPFSSILINQRNGSRTIINRRMMTHLGIEVDFSVVQGLQPKVILLDGFQSKAAHQALEQFPQAVSILDGGSLNENTKALAAKVDYAVVSESFARDYTKMEELASMKDFEKCIQSLKNLCPGQVVVTLGEKGLIYQEGDQVKHMPAYAAQTVDTTGAGDIFHGAFAYGILKKFSFVDNLKFSSATSSLSVEKLGGRQSIPELQEVENRLRDW